MRELTPQQVLDNLKANPENFLGTYPIQILNVGQTSSDVETGSAGEKTFYIRKINRVRAGKWLKKRMHTWYLYTFMPQQPQPNPLTGDINPEYTNLQTFYVPIYWSDDPERNFCPIGDDPVVMITPQLSGCSFVVAALRGRITAQHLQPTVGKGGNVTGDALYDALKDEEGLTVFGKGLVNSDNFIVNIIGVRDRVKGWRIYAQQRNRFADEWKIINVHKVYP